MFLPVRTGKNPEKNDFYLISLIFSLQPVIQQLLGTVRLSDCYLWQEAVSVQGNYLQAAEHRVASTQKVYCLVCHHSNSYRCRYLLEERAPTLTVVFISRSGSLTGHKEPIENRSRKPCMSGALTGLLIP